MAIRRVITGTSPAGKSIVVSDTTADTHIVGGGVQMDELWRSDSTPRVPNDGSMPPGFYFPPPGGATVVQFELPANMTEKDYEVIPGKRPGFHSSQTVDINVVLSGRITFALEDVSVELETHDVIVVNGEDHAWYNPNPEPAVVLTTVLGAHPRS